MQNLKLILIPRDFAKGSVPARTKSEEDLPYICYMVNLKQQIDSAIKVIGESEYKVAIEILTSENFNLPLKECLGIHLDTNTPYDEYIVSANGILNEQHPSRKDIIRLSNMMREIKEILKECNRIINMREIAGL